MEYSPSSHPDMTGIDGLAGAGNAKSGRRPPIMDRFAAALYRHRGWVPVLPILGALIWAEPRRPWWLIGVGMMTLGEIVRCWAAAHLGLAARSSRPLTHKLVTSGPYARTRHPLYWGNACLTLGFVMATGAGWPWFLFLVGAGFFFLYRTHARREEAALAAAFPAEYAAYRGRVPGRRWLWRPAQTVGVPVDATSPGGHSLARAWRVEAWTMHAEFWLLFLLWARVRFF